MRNPLFQKPYRLTRAAIGDYRVQIGQFRTLKSPAAEPAARSATLRCFPRFRVTHRFIQMRSFWCRDFRKRVDPECRATACRIRECHDDVVVVGYPCGAYKCALLRIRLSTLSWILGVSTRTSSFSVREKT